MINLIKHQLYKRYPYVVQRKINAFYRTVPVVFLNKAKYDLILSKSTIECYN